MLGEIVGAGIHQSKRKTGDSGHELTAFWHHGKLIKYQYPRVGACGSSAARSRRDGHAEQSEEMFRGMCVNGGNPYE